MSENPDMGHPIITGWLDMGHPSSPNLVIELTFHGPAPLANCRTFASLRMTLMVG